MIEFEHKLPSMNIDGKHNGNPVEPFYIHEAEYVERFADVLQTDGNNRLDAVVG